MKTDDKSDNTVPFFDRAMGQLHGLPDVVHTSPSNIRMVPDFGIGTATYVLQTYRQREVGDTIFLEVYSDQEHTRLVIPPKVAAAISRQRDQLTGKARSKASKAVAQDRKDRGEKPAFMKAVK